MAIRPADLQLAYLAAPQNAALVSGAQEGPQSQQAAAQAAFAAQVQKREETIEETAKSEHGSAIRTNPDRQNAGGDRQSRKRRKAPQEEPAADGAFDASDGEHTIDFIA